MSLVLTSRLNYLPNQLGTEIRGCSGKDGSDRPKESFSPSRRSLSKESARGLNFDKARGTRPRARAGNLFGTAKVGQQLGHRVQFQHLIVELPPFEEGKAVTE